MFLACLLPAPVLGQTDKRLWPKSGWEAEGPVQSQAGREAFIKPSDRGRVRTRKPKSL